MTPEPEIITHSRPELHLWQYLHTKTDENMPPWWRPDRLPQKEDDI
jgi:hypothetical protein